MAVSIRRPRNYVVDVDLILKDAGAVTATAVGQVGGSNKILDLGRGCTPETWDNGMAGTEQHAMFIVDVTTIDTSSNDELYQIIVEGSNDPAFASGQIAGLAVIQLGAGAVLPGAPATSDVAGRYVIGFTNERGGTAFRYLRVEHVISGTTPSINYTARLAKNH